MRLRPRSLRRRWVRLHSVHVKPARQPFHFFTKFAWQARLPSSLRISILYVPAGISSQSLRLNIHPPTSTAAPVFRTVSKFVANCAHVFPTGNLCVKIVSLPLTKLIRGIHPPSPVIFTLSAIGSIDIL